MKLARVKSGGVSATGAVPARATTMTEAVTAAERRGGLGPERATERRRLLLEMMGWAGRALILQGLATSAAAQRSESTVTIYIMKGFITTIT